MFECKVSIWDLKCEENSFSRTSFPRLSIPNWYPIAKQVPHELWIPTTKPGSSIWLSPPLFLFSQHPKGREDSVERDWRVTALRRGTNRLPYMATPRGYYSSVHLEGQQKNPSIFLDILWDQLNRWSLFCVYRPVLNAYPASLFYLLYRRSPSKPFDKLPCWR